MRQTLMGSALVHVGVIAAVFVLRGPVRSVSPGLESVQVALVDAASLPSPRAQASPPPAPTPPAAKPTHQTEANAEDGVKIAETRKPKPQADPPVKPQVAKPPTPTPPSPDAATTQSVLAAAAPVGRSGLRGAVAVDAGGFEYDYYLQLVRERIGQLWTPPNGLASGGAPLQAVVYFRIGRDGRLSGLKLEQSSGTEFFDRSALRAVLISDPMPPLPAGYSTGDLGVHFGFEYVAP